MGQTRVSSYHSWIPIFERVALEAEVVRRCFSRNETECSFFEYRGFKVIYRRYASLFFIVGVDNSGQENELGILELIHCLVETLDKYFQTVCELDIMHNLDKTHFILNEVVMNGTIVDANRENVLNLRSLEDKHSNVLTRGA